MADTLNMLRTVAAEVTVNVSDLAVALEAVMECEQASTSCAMAMISEGEGTAVAIRRSHRVRTTASQLGHSNAISASALSRPRNSSRSRAKTDQRGGCKGR